MKKRRDTLLPPAPTPRSQKQAEAKAKAKAKAKVNNKDKDKDNEEEEEDNEEEEVTNQLPTTANTDSISHPLSGSSTAEVEAAEVDVVAPMPSVMRATALTPATPAPERWAIPSTRTSTTEGLRETRPGKWDPQITKSTATTASCLPARTKEKRL
jgi:hypothetical protein